MRYRPGIDPDWMFDAMLDEHLEREAEHAYERAETANSEARRPDAERDEILFAHLLVGDYMTMETGTDARWVKVVDVVNVGSDGDPDGYLKVTFKTTQPLGVGMHSRFSIDRTPDERVIVDKDVHLRLLDVEIAR